MEETRESRQIKKKRAINVNSLFPINDTKETRKQKN